MHEGKFPVRHLPILDISNNDLTRLSPSEGGNESILNFFSDANSNVQSESDSVEYLHVSNNQANCGVG